MIRTFSEVRISAPLHGPLTIEASGSGRATSPAEAAELATITRLPDPREAPFPESPVFLVENAWANSGPSYPGRAPAGVRVDYRGRWALPRPLGAEPTTLTIPLPDGSTLRLTLEVTRSGGVA